MENKNDKDVVYGLYRSIAFVGEGSLVGIFSSVDKAELYLVKCEPSIKVNGKSFYDDTFDYWIQSHPIDTGLYDECT